MKYTVNIDENSDQRHLDREGRIMDAGVELMTAEELLLAIAKFRKNSRILMYARVRRLTIMDHEGNELINEDRDQMV